MTAAGRPAGDSRWISSGTPAIARRVLASRTAPAASPRAPAARPSSRGGSATRSAPRPAPAPPRPAGLTPRAPGRCSAAATSMRSRSARRRALDSSGSSQLVGQVERARRPSSGHGAPSARWQNASRSRSARACCVQRAARSSVRSPSSRRPARRRRGSGAADSSIAPSRSTRRAATSPRRPPGGTCPGDLLSVVTGAACRAVSSSMATACRMRAEAEPVGRSATATASHCAVAQLRALPELRLGAGGHQIAAAPRAGATRSGKASATTSPGQLVRHSRPRSVRAPLLRRQRPSAVRASLRQRGA